MTVGLYAPPCYVHPDRYGPVKSGGDDLWFVLHTTEGTESTTSAEGLCSMLGRPGDRPVNGGGTFGASYHVVFDTDIIRPAVPYDTVAYAAAGGNARGRHGVFPGKAGQTREQWLDVNSRAMIRQAAAWLVDQGVGWLWGTGRLSVEQVRASNVHGPCDHHDISRAFKKSDHWDVGPGFPWDVLYADITALAAVLPPPPPLPPSGVIVTDTALIQDRIGGDEGFVFGPGVQLVRVPQAAGKKGVTVQLTVVTPNHSGWVKAYFGPEPECAAVSYNANLLSNGTISVPVDGDGWFALQASGFVRVIVDLQAVLS